MMREIEMTDVVCRCGFEWAVVFHDGPIEELRPYVDELATAARERGLDPLVIVTNGEQSVTCPKCQYRTVPR